MDGRIARGRRRRPRLALLGGLLALVLVPAAASPAQALQWQWRTRDLTPYFAAGSPHFACASGRISFGDAVVTGPGGLGATHDYVTNSVWRWDGSRFVPYYNDTPIRVSTAYSGFDLAPGARQYIPTQTFTLPHGYYWASQEVDWHATSGESIAKTTVVPDRSSDYNSTGVRGVTSQNDLYYFWCAV